MKSTLLILFIFMAGNLPAQNEFAAKAFYASLRDIYEDAQKGFPFYKTDKRPESSASYTDEYNLRSLLLLADSGKIVWPLNGNPFAIFYMEPAKKMEEAEKRAGNLREALEKVFTRTFFVRTESSITGPAYFSDSYFYTGPAETRKFLALFRILVHNENNHYHIQFEIRGRLPKK